VKPWGPPKADSHGVGAPTQPPHRVYEITCRGVVPEAQQEEFAGWTITRGARLTRLTSDGPADQASLHGALDRLATLGLTLVEVRHRSAEAGRVAE
jgi:hypothetical protein